MKYFKVFSGLMAVIAIFIMIMGCNEKEIPIQFHSSELLIQSSISQAYRDSIGSLHNEMLAYMRENNSLYCANHDNGFLDHVGDYIIVDRKTVIKKSLYDRFRNQIIDFANIKGWDYNVVQAELANIDALFRHIGAFKTNAQGVEYVDFWQDSHKILQARLEMGDITQYHYDKLIRIIDEVSYGDPFKMDSLTNLLPYDSLYAIGDYTFVKFQAIEDYSGTYWTELFCYRLEPSSIISRRDNKVSGDKILRHATHEQRNTNLENTLTAIAAGLADASASGSVLGAVFVSAGVGLAMAEYWDSQWCTCPTCGKPRRCN